jgi:cell division protein DivIC
MKKILPRLKNKYVLSMLIFVIWIAFFDDNNFIVQYRYKKKLAELREDEQYYKNEIDKNKRDLYYLTSSKKNLERYAREKFLMKKPNEDIFIFVDENNKRIEQ